MKLEPGRHFMGPPRTPPAVVGSRSSLQSQIAVPDEASKVEAVRPGPGCCFFPGAAARLDARCIAPAVAPACRAR